MDTFDHEQIGETQLTSTDSIIEELKALAKSMLESTEAFRRRACSSDGYKSYDALLSALESSNPMCKGTLESNNNNNNNCYKDPLDVSSLRNKTLERNENTKVTQRPTDFNQQQLFKKKTDALDSILDKTHIENSDGSSTDNEALDVNGDGMEDEEITLEHPRTKKAVVRSSGVDCSADSDDNVYEGVKTQVIFKAVDPTLYDEVSGCTWQPEPLRLRLDTGETMENLSNDEEVDNESVMEEEEVDVKEETKKMYRVPSFPFGGGVTEMQARTLSSLFTETIRRGGHSNALKPVRITRKQFLSYDFEESAVKEEDRLKFKPTSPFEFVVELEREVIFDAVRAREERRQNFRRLAEEGKAPITMGSFNLRVIMDPLKTGFEDEKHFPIERGTIVADRYQIIDLLGKATFSRAVRCYDMRQPIFAEEDDDKETNENEKNSSSKESGKGGEEKRDIADGEKKKKKKVVGYAEVCLKIINNSKDFFDQSLDEIRLLTLINKYKDPDQAHVIRLIDSFYYKEHTMLVTELLSDNLYEYSKYNREEEDSFYFTLPRLQSIARQIVEALAYVHSLNLIHADLKPENILFVSHRRCQIKVIDFGSSCFLSDHLSSYIQSRSYRAPEVILGCDYDGRIDIWSLGAILVELVTGEVLFTSETVPEMLARIVCVCGYPLPRRMLWEGRHTSKFINKFGCIYEQGNKDGEDTSEDSSYYYLYTPVPPFGLESKDKNCDKEEESESEEQNLKNNEEKQESNSAKVDGGNAFVVKPYAVLRQKLAAHNITDEGFLSFVEACLTLDHNGRPTSKDLLSHPFLAHSY